MPNNSRQSLVNLRRIQSTVRVSFLQAAAAVLAGDRDAEDRDVDEQHAALIRELRGRDDQRDRWLDELKAALPIARHAALRGLEEAWAAEALAREEAAYIVGVVLEQSRRCTACSVARRRTARNYRAWLAWVKKSKRGRSRAVPTGDSSLRRIA